MIALTQAQIYALLAAVRYDGAAYGHVSRMGGAYFRMIRRLAVHGLLQPKPPFRITDAGRARIES